MAAPLLPLLLALLTGGLGVAHLLLQSGGPGAGSRTGTTSGRETGAMSEERAAELLHRTLHDPLTGLANRALLDSRLNDALHGGEGRALTVIFCDLDGFKPVNDEHGHSAGDAVLQAVARRLSQAVRAEDTVARLGGDEFAVVCPELPEKGASDLKRRIQEAVSAPIALPAGNVVHIGVSVGTATAVGSRDAGDLLDRADFAMYADKRARSTNPRVRLDRAPR